MIRRAPIFILMILSFSVGIFAAYAQDRQAVKADGEALVKTLRDASNASNLDESNAANVPHYQGTDIPQKNYYDNPESLEQTGNASKYSDPNYRVVTDPYRTTFDPATIDLSRAQAISENPNDYIGPDSDFGGDDNSCAPLPPADNGETWYEHSCNNGQKPFEEGRSCQTNLNIKVEDGEFWEYRCASGPNAHRSLYPHCASIRHHDNSNSCKSAGYLYEEICLQGELNNCYEPDQVQITIYHCDNKLPIWGGKKHNETRIVEEQIDDSACRQTANNSSCSLQNESCIAPDETRTINGMEITRPCWGWHRNYQCAGTGSCQ